VSGEVLLEVRNLRKHFVVGSRFLSRKHGIVRAVEDLSFSIAAGETLGLVGESGSGKSTTARLILRLLPATAGEVLFEGTDVLRLDGQALKAVRRKMQIVFQDPYSSLDPRMRVADIIGEALPDQMARAARRERIAQLLELVGLPASAAARLPHEFSGGQRQRIGIARALAVDPSLIVADEPVSALDVSMQSQILNLFVDLQQKFGLTYLFISHDLSVIKHLAERVAVMYLGHLVEIAPKHAIYAKPLHPYTQALLAAVPSFEYGRLRRNFVSAPGEIPSPLNPPPGCPYSTRCGRATAECRRQMPPLAAHGGQRLVACYHPLDSEVSAAS
jgi:oligopeptide transport system ATP-binding protein